MTITPRCIVARSRCRNHWCVNKLQDIFSQLGSSSTIDPQQVAVVRRQCSASPASPTPRVMQGLSSPRWPWGCLPKCATSSPRYSKRTRGHLLTEPHRRQLPSMADLSEPLV